MIPQSIDHTREDILDRVSEVLNKELDGETKYSSIKSILLNTIMGEINVDELEFKIAVCSCDCGNVELHPTNKYTMDLFKTYIYREGVSY